MKFSMIILFGILWMLDTIFTIMFVGQYGIDAERNPLMQYVIATYGASWFAVIKTLLFVPMIVLYKHIQTWIFALLATIMLPFVLMGGAMALT